MHIHLYPFSNRDHSTSGAGIDAACAPGNTPLTMSTDIRVVMHVLGLFEFPVKASYFFQHLWHIFAIRRDSKITGRWQLQSDCRFTTKIKDDIKCLTSKVHQTSQILALTIDIDSDFERTQIPTNAHQISSRHKNDLTVDFAGKHGLFGSRR